MHRLFRFDVPEWVKVMFNIMLVGFTLLIVACCFVALTYVVFTNTPRPLDFWDYMSRVAIVMFDIVIAISVAVGLGVKFEF